MAGPELSKPVKIEAGVTTGLMDGFKVLGIQNLQPADMGAIIFARISGKIGDGNLLPDLRDAESVEPTVGEPYLQVFLPFGGRYDHLTEQEHVDRAANFIAEALKVSGREVEVDTTLKPVGEGRLLFDSIADYTPRDPNWERD